jgi:uncharacterized protein YcfJ
MNTLITSALTVALAALATPALAQITFYEREGFEGRSFTTQEQIGNLQRYGFNDRASSIIVERERWEVCDEVRFGGRCAVLRQGRYPSLAAMGLNDRVSSVRELRSDARVDPSRYAPEPVATDDYRRRRNERLFEVPVTSVRAVVGPPEQRCWIEHEQVSQDRGNSGVPGAIVGAVIGGILGHQVGGGTGRSVATAGGAVAGAAVGANVGRGRGESQTTTNEVRHCENVPSQARPEFWDVTYTFRGQEHRVQMTSPPGATVTVNGRGEPRQ